MLSLLPLHDQHQLCRSITVYQFEDLTISFNKNRAEQRSEPMPAGLPIWVEIESKIKHIVSIQLGYQTLISLIATDKIFTGM